MMKPQFPPIGCLYAPQEQCKDNLQASRSVHLDHYSWPDLTIVKGNEVKFIEVKTTDKLHKSQLVTIPTFRKIIPYDFSVCRVIR